MLGNSIYWGKYRFEAERQIARSLPSKWRLSLRDIRGDRRFDALLELSAPDGTTSKVAIEFKTEITPATAEPAWRELTLTGQPGLLIAPHISLRTQRYLRDHDINYLDLAGNASWRLDSPALFISINSDADTPKEKLFTRSRRLGGKKAGRLLRYLCDRKPPYSVSELASNLALDPGNISRYLELLSKDALVERGARGIVRSVNWEGVLRRWSEDYRRPAEERFQDPRGMEHFLKRLRVGKEQYVLSGVVAATSYAPYTVANTALCYCDDIGAFAESFRLRQSERGSNVTLATPFDEVVYARTEIRGGLIVGAPTQVAIDLLTGRGRELSQAEELLRWMRETENAWRE